VNRLALFVVLAILPCAACHEPAMKGMSDRAKKLQDYEERTIRVPKNHPKNSVQKPGKRRDANDSIATRRSLDVIAQAYEATRGVTRDRGRA
jgi:hypothetical protein